MLFAMLAPWEGCSVSAMCQQIAQAELASHSSPLASAATPE